eukprot:scaffold74053_cov63-Cyclotella_meneghiniana.AAC.3
MEQQKSVIYMAYNYKNITSITAAFSTTKQSLIRRNTYLLVIVHIMTARLSHNGSTYMDGSRQRPSRSPI